MDDFTLWSSQDSRFVLKTVTHFDKLFTYIDEMKFTTDWLHEDKQAALESWTSKYQEKYDQLDDNAKGMIEQYVDNFVTDSGVVFPVDETLTLLKKN